MTLFKARAGRHAIHDAHQKTMYAKPRPDLPVREIFVAMGRIRWGVRLLFGYAGVGTVVASVVAATETDGHELNRTTGAVLVGGWLLIVAIGVVHRRTRRSLRRRYPDLERVLTSERRRLPGSGRATLVYLPFLIGCMLSTIVVEGITHPGYGLLDPALGTLTVLLLARRLEVWYRLTVHIPYMLLLVEVGHAEMHKYVPHIDDIGTYLAARSDAADPPVTG